MRKLLSRLCLPSLLSLLLGYTNQVHAAPDVGAQRIQFQLSCNSGDNNCFTNADAMLDWIWNVRQPTQTTQLAVDIGPGEFWLPNRFFCDGQSATTGSSTGYVSFNGAGRDITRLTWSSGPGAVIRIRDCTNLNFQDMTVDGWNGRSGITWDGGGVSTWNDMDVVRAMPYAWFDKCTSGQKGFHYWFGSRLEMAQKSGYHFTYRSQCGDTWFYGGDIVAGADGGFSVAVLAESTSSSIRIFGSSTRVVLPASASYPSGTNNGCSISGAAVLIASAGAQIHVHGGIIAAQSNSSVDTNVCGAVAQHGGYIHTPDTAFNLSPSGLGTATRLQVDSDPNSKIDSPFQWPASFDPPTITSLDGADSFVESDCDSSGNCATAPSSDQRPHLMIYSSACTFDGPWFDVATNKCRGE